jgi:conjugal transfer/type IV secretion protein DotA/TraY
MTTAPAEIAAAHGYTADSLIAAEQATTTSDISARHLLEMVFGTIANDPMAAIAGNAGAGDILGTIFMFVNMGLLTLGSIYLTYQTLAAITETAHHGEFMGKKISTVWAPIRIIVGIFSLIPVAGGWSIIQVAMLWFGIMGAGLGNMAWQGVVGADFKPFSTMTLSPPVGSPMDSRFAGELVKMHVCIKSHNAQFGNENNQYTYSNLISPGKPEAINFGNARGGVECGQIELNSNENGLGQNLNTKLSYTQYDGKWDNFGSDASTIGIKTNAQKAAIAAAVKTEFDLVNTKAEKLADQFVNGDGGMAKVINSPDDVEKIARLDPVQIRNLGIEYQTRMTDAVAKAMSSVDALPEATRLMKQRAQTDGFTSAGAWYRTMAETSYMMNSLTQNIAPAIIKTPDEPHPDESIWKMAYSHISESQNASEANPDKPGAKLGDKDAAWKMVMEKMDGGLGQKSVAWMISETSGEPVMIRLKSFADSMIGVASVAMTGVGAVQGVISASENTPVAGIAARAITGAIHPWLDLLGFAGKIAFGFFLTASIYLPMIPFIIFMGQVLNWLITVVEGVAAAPFLAFAHFDTDGEGLGHKTQYGYVFMLTSFMRPVMLVLGFVFGAMLLEAIGGYVMNIYPTVIANVQMDSITGFFSIIGFTSLFFFIMTGLITSCFSVTYLLPDAIFAFIGAHNSATAQVGRDTNDKVAGASAVGALAVRQVGRMPQRRGKSEKEQGGSIQQAPSQA